PIGGKHVVVFALAVRGVEVERVAVLHDELAATHETEARAYLVSELHLDLVEVERHITVGTHVAAHQIRHHLLVRRPKAEVAVVAILEPQQLLAVAVPAAALLPELGGTDGGQQDLLRAGARHLFADDALDLAQHADTEREEVVDPARYLPDHARAQQQLVAHDLGLGRN